jgi:hypothetical protein
MAQPGPRIPTPSPTPQENQYQYIACTETYVSLCDPPLCSITNQQVIDLLAYNTLRYRSRDLSTLLRGGIAYKILNEVNAFFRLDLHVEDGLLRAIKDTEIELTRVCVDYLDRWETYPGLRAQLPEVESEHDPARHYYQTCFAVNCRGEATLLYCGTQGIRAQYQYYVPHDHNVEFIFYLQPTLRRHTMTLSWAQVPYYTERFVFGFRNAIQPPSVMGLAPLPFSNIR